MAKRSRIICLAALLLFLVDPRPGFTQPQDELNALRHAVEELREDQRTLEQEMQEIKRLLQERPAVSLSARPAPGHNAYRSNSAGQEHVKQRQ